MKISAAESAAAAATLCRDGWLSRTPAAFQAAILGAGSWQFYPADTALTYGGDHDGAMFGLARGTIGISSATGPADLPAIDIQRAPFWFGIAPLVAHGPRRVSISVRSDSVVLRVPQSALDQLLAENPAWWRLLAMQLLDHFDIAAQIASDLLVPDSQRRCMAVLLRVSGCRARGAVSGEIAIGQDEFAAMANMSRQSASATLRALAAQGLIEIGYRRIKVNDAARLQVLLDS